MMMVALKSVLKEMGVLGAMDGFISSYCLCNMVIAFLQSKDILPNLQSTDKSDTLNVSKYAAKNKKKIKVDQIETGFSSIPSHESKNSQSLSELVLQFLYFYRYEFDS